MTAPLSDSYAALQKRTTLSTASQRETLSSGGCPEMEQIAELSARNPGHRAWPDTCEEAEHDT